MKCFSVLNTRGLKLKCILNKAKSNKIIILAHGYGGNKSENGTFDEAALLFSKSFNVLQFDFSGCGESEDSHLNINYLLDDLNCIINYVNKKGFKKIGLLGYSLGGLLSIKSLKDNVNSLILWAPLTNSINLKIRYNQDQLSLLKKNGFLVTNKFKNNGNKIIIDSSLIEELNNVNQKELLNKVEIPTLIVHGENDFVIPINHSKKAVSILKNSKLIIIENCNHSIKENKELFIKYSFDWFKNTL